jgi:hypothetical protein
MELSMSTTIYHLIIRIGTTGLGYDFSDRSRAVAEAQKALREGAREVHVYHYTNNGANCIDDFRSDDLDLADAKYHAQAMSD